MSNPLEREWPQEMSFSTECPNCGNLDMGHKRGCSDPTPCVEHVSVVPESSDGDLANRIYDALQSDDGCLGGPLGEAIANRSGNYSLECCSPEDVRDGIIDWLGGPK